MTGQPLHGQPATGAKPAGTRFGLALAATIVLFSLLNAPFLTYDTSSTIASRIPDLVGMAFVPIVAGIDLSVGSMLALGASVVGVAALQWRRGALPAATGTPAGAVTLARWIPSFIVSPGVLEAARGLAYRMTNSRAAYIGDAFDFLSNPIAFGISPALLIAVVAMGARS